MRLAHGYRHDADGNLVEAYVVADMNCDGLMNNFDVDPFVLALTNLPGYYQQYPNCNILNADVNGDGVVNNFDVDAFLALLGTGNTGLYVKYTWDAENRLTLVEPLAPQPDRQPQRAAPRGTGSPWVGVGSARRRCRRPHCLGERNRLVARARPLTVGGVAAKVASPVGDGWRVLPVSGARGREEPPDPPWAG